ncbi:monooxygenase 1-like isoform X2 [Panicum virgatum]|uniref:FAD-binding domain-containing protein n=1 Tax=Panicum virgatum TaxID=38727 RepID=A0A8T0XJN9_PANVG|nr:monooxygenase 1-like isoform X2 [Panicum virgatum]KAG2659138.1 hypothetical protein PVAP13_1KG334600 [Panicum virgatum]
MAEAEAHGIVIVGGGICGLATALALHRKGIASLVLEKSEVLRAEGAGIGVQANGWRALEQLGVAGELRKTAGLITSYHDVWMQGDKTTRDRYPVRTELRCLNRKDLIEALAKDLPAGAIRFGCRIAAVHEDPGGHGAVLTMADGTTINAKVLIGCDGGTNSVVASYLGLPPVRTIPRPVLRGFTSYPHGHPFENEFLRLRVGDFFVGRLTITDNLVHFFVTMPAPSAGLAGADLRDVRDRVQKELEDRRCPAEITEVVRGSDPESLNLVTKFWYRPPWEVALGGFRKGAVTVAGDAMHAMGPFIGQGGSAGLEDAVVLARSLARARAGAAGGGAGEVDDGEAAVVAGGAIAAYIRERRLRLALLSLESYVMGVLLVRSPSPAVKLACVAVLLLLGSKSLRHANFDCGRL